MSNDKNKFYAEYDAFENSLLAQFVRESPLQHLSTVSREQFISLLLQLGHLSDMFVWWLQRIKHSLVTSEASVIIQSILEDEVPVGQPTHQDNRRYDLVEIMGVSPERFMNEPATEATKEALVNARRVIELGELSCMTAFRLFGELLVGETYEHVALYMTAKLGIAEQTSRFYVPHRNEDRKARKGGHPGLFESYLRTQINSPEALEVAKRGAMYGYEARLAFVQQFAQAWQ